MKDLKIYPSQDTPKIDFKTTGELSIVGISVPENVHTHYQDLFTWLEMFKNDLPQEVTLNVNLEYMNTSSVKMLVKLIQTLIKICSEQAKLTINWISDEDDEELIEEGELLQECVNYPFQFIRPETK